MSYRELLELAARAAGIEGIWSERGRCILPLQGSGMTGQWRPMEDDGDALRLAAQLQFDLSLGHRGATVRGFGGRILAEVLCHPVSGANLECARHAIVRAAAEIGKNVEFSNISATSTLKASDYGH